MGAELELIPVEAATHRIAPAFDDDRPGSLAAIQAVAAREGWREIPADDDPPSWSLGDGWRLSYEPGGQLEISSAPSGSASGMVDRMLAVVESLRTELLTRAIELRSVGVDPCNHVGDIPLVLHRPRYTRMTEYFDRLHSSGAQMMRQSASIQINIEIGAEPAKRWHLLNALTPFLTAMFANSPQYRGVPTGHRSYRAHLWRTLDVSRTGLPVDMGNPVDAYLEFALDAGAMMAADSSDPSFREWIGTGSPTIDDWRFHLTTLFPEVRPKSWFEVRSVDALEPEWIAAPIAAVCGIVYSPRSAALAAYLAGEPNEELLSISGEQGLRDTRIADTSIKLARLALEGLEELGDTFFTQHHRARARQFFDRYTFRNRAPADDRD